MRGVRNITALLVVLVAVAAGAQVQLPELSFPSANGKHDHPITVQRIRGIVVDENDAVIPSAQVEVKRKKGQGVREIAKAVTDSTGRFQFDMPKGTYEVTFRMKGFSPETVSVDLSDKGGPGLKLTLRVAVFVDPIEVQAPSAH